MTMAKKAQLESSLVGGWRITLMEQWDQSFVDVEVKGFFDFRPNGQGDFQFGYVSGEIVYRQTTRDGKPAIEFSWDGNDEMDTAQGRGWATLVAKNTIEGMVFFHHGDQSAFRATRKKSKSAT